jgi:hypothetical protein
MGKEDSRRVALLCMLALVGCGAAASGADVTASADFNSAYVWRGITFANGGVVQPALDISGIKIGKVGLGVNVWANFNPGSSEGRVRQGQFSEVDLTLTASLPSGFKVGYIEYIFAIGNAPEPVVRPIEPSTRELMISWSRTMAVTPTVSFYYDVEQIDAPFLVLSLARRVDLSKKAAATFTAEAGYTGEKFAQYYEGSKGGLYHFNLTGRVSYQVRDKLSLSGFLGYADGFDRTVLPKQDARLYLGLGITTGL